MIIYNEKEIAKIKIINGKEILVLPVHRVPCDQWIILETVNVCPLCGFKHRHGVGNSLKLGAGDGYRTPHCGEIKNGFPLIKYNGDYYITEIYDDNRKKFEEELKKLNIPEEQWV